MSNAAANPGKPGSHTYIFDPESEAELARLMNQDRFTTQAMGGPLAGLPELPAHAQVLDLGCGPGGWVLDVAFEHPDFEVAGVDISRPMIAYASARAVSQELANASFGVMDITQPLDFADASFDLLNARYLFAVLRREAWAPFIQECHRLLRPGGILRLTEIVDTYTTSAAFARSNALFYQFLWKRGYGFSPDGGDIGVAWMLPPLLRAAHFEAIQSVTHTLEVSSGSPAWPDFFHNTEVAYALLLPSLVKTGLVAQEEGDQLYQQVLIDLQQERFVGMQYFMTCRGIKHHPLF